MNKLILISALTAAVLFDAGCASSGSAVSKTDFLQSAQVEPQKLSQLESGDTIEVSVEVDGTLEVVSHRATLNHAGIATLPLVGDVKLGGYKLGLAQKVIADTYGAYYVQRPVVMLSLVTDGLDDGAWGSIIVMGKVVQPGRVALRKPNGVNLTEVIQDAGGFSASAKKSEIRVTRTNKEGEKLLVFVDYDAIGQSGDASADVKLIAGDVVYVPERIW